MSYKLKEVVLTYSLL